MADQCAHLELSIEAPAPSAEGCHDCLDKGSRNWVHLRVCQGCGRVGCCDNSPGQHATAHNRSTGHPLVRSYEPGEDWWYCYPDDVMFHVEGAPAAPSYS